MVPTGSKRRWECGVDIPLRYNNDKRKKPLFWCATRQVDILNIERFLAFAARNRAAFLRC